MGTKVLVAVFLVTLAATRTITKPNEDHEKRVVDKELSDQDHYKEGEHNAEYDHDAFLGEQEAKTFDELTPEESRERLGKLVEKIDKDGDGKVSDEELKAWIKYVQTKYMIDDAERQWKDHQLDDAGFLTFDKYREQVYGAVGDDDAYKDEKDSYGDMVTRDEERWKTADQDSDGKLNKEEFGNFLHPEEAPHMRDVVVRETMNDMDKDKDGFISQEEFIGDMWPNEGKEEEPDWVQTEKEQFQKHRDKDGDGKMSFDEVKDWVLPDDYDHIEAEAKHLMNEADVDKDGELTKDEILNKYDVFVGSQATDYGEALNRHEEF